MNNVNDDELMINSTYLLRSSLLYLSNKVGGNMKEICLLCIQLLELIFV